MLQVAHRGFDARGCLVALTLLVLSQPLTAQPTSTGQNYAILIGVANFESPILRKLPFAEKDVTELAKVLQERGFPKDNIVLMTATEAALRGKPRFNPRARNIRKELDNYLSIPRKGDTVLVVLSGHGVQFRGDNEHYFCPIDADLKAKRNLISMPELYQQLEKCKASVKLILADACRNNPLKANAPKSASDKVASKTRPKIPDPPGGVGAFFSCSRGQEAYEAESLKHGVFFHFILEGLRGKAANRDKEITVGDLTAYVSRNVNRFTVRELGVKQQPDLLGRINLGVPLAVLGKPGGGNPIVLIETTKGTIKAELFENQTPITVKNFLGYVDQKFYDNTIFHRVIPKFMIQGGGFEPGVESARTQADIDRKEKKTRPPIKNEAKNAPSNLRGTLSMARTSVPDSATAQFFINLVDNSKFLDFNPSRGADAGAGYTVFGKVLEGMDVVDKIAAVKTKSAATFKDVPVDPIVIKKIRRVSR